jgi:hypothetical protein
MTATIDPGNAKKMVKRSDPYQRLDDYQMALKFWIELPEPRIRSIVFSENSGFDLTVLRKMVHQMRADRLVEFMQTCDNEIPCNMHYGFSEAKLIETSLKVSQQLQQAQKIIKATGRLMYPGISKLLDSVHDDFRVAVDCRGSVGLRGRRIPFVRTDLMLFDVEFYKTQLLDASSKMIEAGVSHIENFFYRELLKFHGHPGVILRWPIDLDPVGYAAHWEKRYDTLGRKAASKVRSVIRRILPNWWL